MKKKLISFVIFIFIMNNILFSNSYCQTMTLNKISFIDTLLYKSDSLSVGMALLHLNDLQFQIKRLKVYKAYDTIYHVYNKDNKLTKNNYNELFNWFNNYPEGRTKQKIKNNLLEWIRFEDILNFTLAANDTIYIEELFYNIPSFKPLFRKYIISNKQYWGSLTESQSLDLYYDCLNYISHLNQKQEILFYKQYFNTVANLLHIN